MEEEDGLDKCRLLYLDLTTEEMANRHFSRGDTRGKDWTSLKEKLRDSLYGLKLGQKFRHSIFDSLLHEKYVAKQPKWDYNLVARAFEYLETYCRLLRTYPWKTEYHTLKTHGGFFRTYIQSVLPGCMVIFKIIGYSPVDVGGAKGAQAMGPSHPEEQTTVFKLNSVPNIALLETIGFDCLAASVECEMRHHRSSESAGNLDLMSNKLSNLQLDEIVSRGGRVDLKDNKMLIRNKHIGGPVLADKKRVLSLPRELEPFPARRTRPPAPGEFIRSMAKCRTYHFEKLDTYQKRRSYFTDFEGDSSSNNDCLGVNFKKSMSYNPEHVRMSAHPEENPRD